MQPTPDAETVRAERTRRQRLDRPLARRDAYEGLFRTLQPATTGAYARPGSPPHLAHRTRFDGDAAAAALRRERRIVKGRFQGGGVAYVLGDTDATGLAARAPQHPPRMLPQKDYLSRSHESELRQRYAGADILQYLFVRGAFRGVVLGRWGFKPYDVQDVVVELPARERDALRDEVLEVVGAHYHEPSNRILRYAGRPVSERRRQGRRAKRRG
jgi:hypothetical protein